MSLIPEAETRVRACRLRVTGWVMDPVFEARVKTLHEELIQKGNYAICCGFIALFAHRTRDTHYPLT
jgi:hypothetical protein